MISYHFPPTPETASVRVGKFAKYLPEFGWQAIVVTRHPGSCSEGSACAAESIRQTHAVRYASGILEFKGAYRLNTYLPFPALLYPWVRSCYRLGKQIIRKEGTDAIWVTGPPAETFIAGYWLKRATGKPLVLDFRDEWSNNPYIRYASRWHRRCSEWWEQRVVSIADDAAVIGTSMREELVQHWKSLRLKRLPRVHVLRNGFDPADFVGECEWRSLRDKPQWTIRHLGILYAEANEATALLFLEAMHEVASTGDLPSVRIEFVGKVPAKLQRAVRIASTWGRLEVSFQGQVAHSEAVRQMREADCLLVFVGRYAGAKIEVKSKVYEYLAARRPVLILDGGEELLEIVKDIPRVWCGSPTPETLRQAFDHFQRLTPLDLKDDGATGLEKYSRREIAGELARILDRCAVPGESGLIDNTT